MPFNWQIPVVFTLTPISCQLSIDYILSLNIGLHPILTLYLSFVFLYYQYIFGHHFSFPSCNRQLLVWVVKEPYLQSPCNHILITLVKYSTLHLSHMRANNHSLPFLWPKEQIYDPSCTNNRILSPEQNIATSNRNMTQARSYWALPVPPPNQNYQYPGFHFLANKRPDKHKATCREN